MINCDEIKRNKNYLNILAIELFVTLISHKMEEWRNGILNKMRWDEMQYYSCSISFYCTLNHSNNEWILLRFYFISFIFIHILDVVNLSIFFCLYQVSPARMWRLIPSSQIEPYHTSFKAAIFLLNREKLVPFHLNSADSLSKHIVVTLIMKF